MLKLIKKGDKYWLFEDSQIGLFSPSKFTINLELNDIVIVYENGLKSKRYNVSDCEIYDLGATSPFTTSSGDLFMQKLEELNCPCFQKNENIFNISGGAWGDITGTLSDQTDLQNALDLKLDKVSTPSSVYTTDAGGLQVMKPLIEFKDVLEFTNLASFPVTGETGKIYLALDTNITYRWTGYVYVQIGGANRVAICDLGRFLIKVPSINTFVVGGGATLYYNPNLSTNVTNHLLLSPSNSSIIYKVPFDCSLIELSISVSTLSDSNISIWKTNPNQQSLNPIELFYAEDSSGNVGIVNFKINSGTILKDSYIHIFYARRLYTSNWNSVAFLRFKEI